MADEPENWVCPSCGTEVDISTLGLYAEVQCPQCSHSAHVHTTLGNYTLQGVLGIGGMSVVYRALDVELNRPLALKVLNESFRDQADRAERFENECAMMARVRHENVTSVYSAGHAFGQFYIAMEMVAGKNLEHIVTPNKPLRPLRAIGIIRQVALGLEAAAKAGLLHRDMKPGNVLISPGDKVKVIDFGLAVDSQEGDTEEIIWATPYYVPPETLERQPEDVRTDIYALGMTLRYLLTGIEQFDAPTDSISALTECKLKLLPLAKQCPRMPAALCKLVDHMTKFSAADRPKDYTELLKELDDVQQELAEAERQLLTPVSRWRKPKTFIAPAAVLSLLLGTLYAFYKLPPKPQPEQTYIPLSHASLPAPNIPALSNALNLIKEHNYAQAVSSLLSLADSTADPTIGAWAARLAQVLLLSQESDPAAYLYAKTLLSKHLNSSDKVQDIHRQSFEALRQALDSEARLQPSPKEWKPLIAAELHGAATQLDSSHSPAPVQMTQWFILAELAYQAGDTALYSQCIQNLSKLALPEEYQELASTLCRQPAPAVRASTPLLDIRTKIATLMRRHELNEELRDVFFKLQKSDDYATAQQARVLFEVSGLTDELRSLIERKLKGQYVQGMNSIQLAELVGRVQPETHPTLKEEVHIVGRLMEGEREEVFADIERLASQHKLSEIFSTIGRNWIAKWRSAAATVPNEVRMPAIPLPLLGPGIPPMSAPQAAEKREQYIAKLIERCNNCVLVKTLPEKRVVFASPGASPLGAGQMMFCSKGVAQILIDKGLVELIDEPIVAILGISAERYGSYSVRPGEIQPCKLESAKYFEQIGAAKIVRSAADLNDELRGKMKDDPRPHLLTREVSL